PPCRRLGHSLWPSGLDRGSARRHRQPGRDGRHRRPDRLRLQPPTPFRNPPGQPARRPDALFEREELTFMSSAPRGGGSECGYDSNSNLNPSPRLTMRPAVGLGKWAVSTKVSLSAQLSRSLRRVAVLNVASQSTGKWSRGSMTWSG